MERSNGNAGGGGELRRRAAARLRDLVKREDIAGIDDIAHLVEELSLHQVELEMQEEELRRANEELRLARDLYFQNFVSAPMPVFRVCRDGLIEEANIAGAELLGLDWGAWKRRPLSLLTFIEKTRERARLRDSLSRTFEGREADEVEVELSDGKGAIRAFSVVVQRVATPEEQLPRNALLFLREVTEARAHRREIERLSLIAQHTKSGVLFTDTKRRISWCNDSFLQLTGYTASEVYGRTPSFLQGPGTDKATVRRMRAALAREEGFVEDVLNYKKSGETYWVRLEVIPRVNSHGELEGYFSVQTDVTRRLHREQELRALRMAVEQSPSTVVITDPTGAITYANPAFERTSGYTVEEALGKNPRLLKSGAQPSDYYARMWRDLKAGRAWEGTFHNRRKDGTLYWEHANIAPVFDEDGTLTAYIAVKRDITSEKEDKERLADLNRQLREAAAYAQKMADEADAANRAKSEFLANMSHEIRTPMNGVLGLSEILAETELTEEQRDLVSGVRTSGEVLLTTINEILDFSRIEAGRLELYPAAFETASFFNDFTLAMRPAAERRGLAFSVDLDPGLPSILVGDELRIRQVLANLVTNAVKFTPRGFVKVCVRVEGACENGVTLRFSVSDSGIGVPADKQDILFREFSQVDNRLSRLSGGSGLGLAISKRLIGMMGGGIGVVSPREVSAPEGEQGSEFYFRLTLPAPESADSPAHTPTFPANPRSSGNGEPLRGRVLVVEDNPHNLAVARLCLRKLGYVHEEVDTGAEALRALRKEHFDAVLMDLRMPGMDGYELTGLVRSSAGWATPPDVPVIAVTAHALSRDRERCLEAGMNEHVAKPFRVDHLGRVLERWVRANGQNSKPGVNP